VGVVDILTVAAEGDGISHGEWLIGGATLLLAFVTAMLALVAFVQLTAARDEARRTRTYDLYARYYSDAFLAPRLAVKKAQDAAGTADGLRAASLQLVGAEALHFDRYQNFLEEASQQYLAGQLDRAIADEGLAYLAWFHWPEWRAYVAEQRVAQHEHRVCENWEALHHEVSAIYAPPAEHDAMQIAESWMTMLAGSEYLLGRRFDRLVSKRKRFRLGLDQHGRCASTEALAQIKNRQWQMRAFAGAPMTKRVAGQCVACFTDEGAAGGRFARAAVLELGAERLERRWRAPTVRYVVSGFVWYPTRDEALAAIGIPAGNAPS
jgi:hypothetical protein